MVNPNRTVTFKLESSAVQRQYNRSRPSLEICKKEQNMGTAPPPTFLQGARFSYYSGLRIGDLQVTGHLKLFLLRDVARQVPWKYPEEKVDLYLPQKGVPQGALRSRRLYSKVLRRNGAGMYVYTPPCREFPDNHFPVLYLQHGGDEKQKRVGPTKEDIIGAILDNLIASGKAKPMRL